jgi:hypothetical protein
MLNRPAKAKSLRRAGATKTLTIDNRKGEYPGMAKKRTFTIEWIAPDKKNFTSAVTYTGDVVMNIEVN